MYFYTTYGLNIQSVIAIPELLVGGNGEDIRIDYGYLGFSPSDHPESNCILATPDRVVLFWEQVGYFQIERGQSITIEPAPGVTEDTLRLFVLGSSLATLMRQRGLLVLHASAVAIDEQVIAFIGDKGWGKSTTAAALHARGHRLVCDDLVVVDFDERGIAYVRPGYPQFKLWPEALASLGSSVEDLPRIRPELDKRAKRVQDGFERIHRPLGQIYILGGGDSLQITTVPAPIALLQVVRHVYVARYGTSFFQQTGSSEHFQQCTQLLKHVQVRLLQRRADLSALTDIAVLIEQNARQQP